MYETLGNAEATAVVTRSVALLARIVADARRPGRQDARRRPDGDVPEPPAGASQRVRRHARLAGAHRLPPAGSDAADAAARRRCAAPPVPLKLQVGLAHGEVVEMSGDVFGDAVNVAARLLDHAGDNETLVTASVVERPRASGSARASAASTGCSCAAGSSRCTCTCWRPVRRFGDTAATAFGDMRAGVVEPEGIRLIWLDLNRIYAGTSLPVILGRSPQATYIIDDTACRARTRGSTGTAAPSSSPTSATTAPTSASTTTPRSSACAAAPARCTAAA